MHDLKIDQGRHDWGLLVCEVKDLCHHSLVDASQLYSKVTGPLDSAVETREKQCGCSISLEHGTYSKTFNIALAVMRKAGSSS
jgi:hypothetical protein